jgi:hypothetical protein
MRSRKIKTFRAGKGKTPEEREKEKERGRRGRKRERGKGEDTVANELKPGRVAYRTEKKEQSVWWPNGECQPLFGPTTWWFLYSN